ncbi:VOC family protein [Edaphobacter paludis]|uniref:VOC family protein n=1 Tax=Edaphobacter paludis TaxID=3035702 RepID=A0AAU7CWY8_9BACT
MIRQSLRSRVRSVASIASLALASLLCVSSAKAQGQQQTPALNGIAHIAIRVHNLDAARDFYKKLGFDEAFALSKNGAVYQSFIKLDDRQFIELYPTTAKDTEIGFLHLCFESDNLQAVYDDYIARGVTPNFKIRKAGAGNLLFTLKGPMQATGPQNIEYTQYMPGSRHYSDRGQHLGTDRVGTKLVSVTLAMQDPAAARDFYLKQLQFTPDAHHPMTLNLPGDSGEQVEIVPVASLGSKGRILLSTSSLGRSSKLLKQAHVIFKKSKKALTVTDPDGNLIVIEAR